MTKRIVICCDGTWNTPDQPYPTNVLKMARAVKSGRQIRSRGRHEPDVLNDAGIGAGGMFDRWGGGAFGRGLVKNIGDAYRFPIQNYAPRDQVFLFGFSRGAYTARSTVGLIRNCGLLTQEHGDRFDEALSLYRRRDDGPDTSEAIEFKRAYSREIELEFLGVWDTVGALGIPLRGLNRLTGSRYQFHDIVLPRIVKRAYHALAIDELRFAFRPTLREAKPRPRQVVDQVWFAGSHGDVGGGYQASGLAGIAFTWMLQKAEDAGLELDDEYVDANVQSVPLDHLHNSRTSFFKLSPSHAREIGSGNATNQAVHPAAIGRYDSAIPPYRPSNLEAYLSEPAHRIADVRDE